MHLTALGITYTHFVVADATKASQVAAIDRAILPHFPKHLAANLILTYLEVQL